MNARACLACGRVHPDARDVRLTDGRLVSSYSEDWRLECEARAVLKLSSQQRRRAYLFGESDPFGRRTGGVEQKRGREAAEALGERIRQIWEARKRQQPA